MGPTLEAPLKPLQKRRVDPASSEASEMLCRGAVLFCFAVLPDARLLKDVVLPRVHASSGLSLGGAWSSGSDL